MTDVSVSIAAAALIATVVLGWLGARRAAYERVMTDLGLVSEGPAADTRHELGRIIYEFPDAISTGSLILTDDVDVDVGI